MSRKDPAVALPSLDDRSLTDEERHCPVIPGGSVCPLPHGAAHRIQTSATDAIALPLRESGIRF
jgi:hypothetical protein